MVLYIKLASSMPVSILLAGFRKGHLTKPSYMTSNILGLVPMRTKQVPLPSPCTRERTTPSFSTYD